MTKTIIVIDETAVEQLLDRAVANRGPDWKYPAVDGTCFYSIDHHNDMASIYWTSCGEDPRETDSLLDLPGQRGACIVGHILIDLLGVREEFMAEWEDSAAFQRGLPDVPDYIFTAEAQVLLRQVQQHQDAGMSWGQAVRRAKEECGVVKGETHA
jgi:hypothetical protein